ncbi:hypothetical protein [Alloactinosynnema sp. L-07]|uniref:hypothetical protein n=1 Tax=Alloactinosynnema sp. L-07 TaxID=1653480 RepID=UPI0006B5E777|nr:hypothetical protein [Alloactinosynnema sp. L-07]
MFDVGSGVSANWLRVVIALVCGGILVDIARHGVGPLPFGFAVTLAVACVFIPASPAPLLLICVAAAALTATVDSPFAPGVLVLLPLVHLLHLSCAIAALLPRRARIALAALRGPLRRAAVTQAVVWLMVLVGALVPVGRTPMILELAGLLSIAGIAVVVIVLDRAR